jgi:aldehyde dehydrogenase (NAD+)
MTTILNAIAGTERPAASGQTFSKVDPATGRERSVAARSGAEDVAEAVAAAKAAQRAWARETVAQRGALLRRVAQLLERDTARLSEIVAGETGKSIKDATGETGAAIEQAYFASGEGRRWFGTTTTSAVPHRQAMTLRQPIGVAGLIVPANTPLPNIAWKAFPALLCGNGIVLKASEDAPEIALEVWRLAVEAGIPADLFNVVQGLGREAGQALVEHRDVGVISFTGSTGVGRMIASVGGERMAKVCLELGGKNALVVCDDGDLAGAAQAAVASAFSNAGQRCASGSRVIAFDSVYDEVRDLIVREAEAQRVGTADEDHYGPVINARQLDAMEASVRSAREQGATILTGGERLDRDGFFMAPTVVENAPLGSEIACTELFGPIVTLHRVAGFDEAIDAVNDSPYGLTAAIWSRSVHRGQEFIARVQTGVASVNGPTYGSEPHMPFGGVKDSGNGWREAGPGSIDQLSELKTVYVNHDPAQT